MTTPPNPPEVDVLAVIDRYVEDRADSVISGKSAGAGPLNMAARRVLAAEAIAARTAVAELLTREAALVARNEELERLCDSTYVEQGADAYHHACEVMEAWQVARRGAGKDPGCEGSLCDGLSWLQTRITKTEDKRDALAAEVGALRLDAERWRFLISPAIYHVTIESQPAGVIIFDWMPHDGVLNNAIDKARAEAGHG